MVMTKVLFGLHELSRRIGLTAKELSDFVSLKSG